MPPDAIEIGYVRRVLVIKLRHHGDVLLTTPVFRALRQVLPDAEVDALVYAETSPLLEGNPDLAQVYVIDKNWKNKNLAEQARNEWALFQQLRARNYDLIVHLTENKRGLWLARLLNPRYAVAPHIAAGRIANWFWRTTFTHRYHTESTNRNLVQRHVVEQNLDALRRIGIVPPEDRALVLHPIETARHNIAQRLAQAGLRAGEYIVLHPGSRWLFKCWSVERNRELIAHLLRAGKQVVYTAAPDTRELAMRNAIVRGLDDKTGLHDFSGSLNLQELAVLIGQAHCFIGVDSAPMHIAAAMQTPTVALFGPSGEKAWGPWQVANRVITSDDHPCRPCGQDGCGGGKISECLTHLPLARVLRAVEELTGSAAIKIVRE
ncbi:MAG: putative lipopolysaccharide heptosyltransferase III [Burkholderiaceae bacterium]|nr:MAG: putative lipopolysaccharide heptosyltransferase III [Burkholderiaceae bacterium]